MTWEIFAGIVLLVGFLISVMTPIIKLNASITKLNCSIDELNTQMQKSDKRLDAHSLKLDQLTLENAMFKERFKQYDAIIGRRDKSDEK